MEYRYYLKARAPSPGAQPSGFIAMEDYGVRKLFFLNSSLFGYQYFKAWGHVDYKEKLTVKQVDDYELVYGGISE